MPACFATLVRYFLPVEKSLKDVEARLQNNDAIILESFPLSRLRVRTLNKTQVVWKTLLFELEGDLA